MQQKRRMIWIDKAQTKLMVRIAIYIVIMQATMVIASIIFEQIFNVAQATGTSFNIFGIAFLAVFFIFPTLLLLYDALQLMHRVVGPVFRFRKVMQAIAAGEEVGLVRLRKGDYLNEVQDDMNLMLKALAARGAITLSSETPGVEGKPAEVAHSDAIEPAQVVTP